jgi:hypothetical protein
VKQRLKPIILSVALSQMLNSLVILFAVIGELRIHYIGGQDVALKENDCRIRKDNAPQNFAILRHIAVNLLGQEKRVKRGIKNKQFLAGLDNNYLARVLALA